MATTPRTQTYRIKRGSITLRHGPEVKDVNSGKMVRAHVTYQAKTAGSTDARDEVQLTDEQARKFGLNRLQRLHRGDNRTLPAPPPLRHEEKLEENPEDDFKDGVPEKDDADIENDTADSDDDGEAGNPGTGDIDPDTRAIVLDLIAIVEESHSAPTVAKARAKIVDSHVLKGAIPTTKNALLQALRNRIA